MKTLLLFTFCAGSLFSQTPRSYTTMITPCGSAGEVALHIVGTKILPNTCQGDGTWKEQATIDQAVVLPLAQTDVTGLPAALTAAGAHAASTTNPHNVTAAQAGAVPTTSIGAINGVAGLDGTGKVPTAQLPAGAASGPIASGLLAEYRFQNGSGTTVTDYSGNTNSGTLVNSPTWLTGGMGVAFIAANSQTMTIPAGISSSVTTVQILCDCTAYYGLPAFAANTFHPLLGSSGLQISLSGHIVNAGLGPIDGRVGTFNGTTLVNESADTIPANRPVLITVAWNTSTLDTIAIDSRPISLMFNSNVTSPATTGSGGIAHGSGFSLMGNPAAGQYSSGTVYWMAMYSSALTTAQIAQNYRYATNLVQSAGVQLTTSNATKSNSYVAVGDSRTAGANLNTYASLIAPTDAFSLHLHGVNSESVDQMLAGLSGPLSWYAPNAKRNVLSIWGCFNDWYRVTASRSAAACFADVVAVAATAKKAGFQTLVFEEISDTSTGLYGGLTGDQLKNQFNALVDANTGLFDGIVPVGHDPNLGCDGCGASTTYFQDGIHPTQAGHNIIASLVTTAINSLTVKAVSSVSSSVPTTNLLQSWPLSEGISPFFENSGHANNITGTNLTFATQAGVVGTIPKWNGTTSTAVSSNQTYTNFTGTTPFSFSGWVSFADVSSTSGRNTIVSTFDTANNVGWEVNKFPTAGTNGIAVALFSNYSTGKWLDQVTTVSLTANALYHLAFTYDGSRLAAGLKIYINGVLATSTTTDVDTLSGLTINNSQPLSVGVRSDGSNKHNGGIADLRIFSRALSSSEVAALYSAGAQ